MKFANHSNSERYKGLIASSLLTWLQALPTQVHDHRVTSGFHPKTRNDDNE